MAASSLLRHIRNYGSASLVGSMVGLITFPLLTRYLSVEEYGILGLVTVSLSLFVAVGKLGVQHSVIRHFEEVNQGHSQYTNDQLNSTVFTLLLVLTLATLVAWLFTGWVVLPIWVDYSGLHQLFLVTAGILCMRQMSTGFVNFLRAQQRSSIVATYQVMLRLIQLCLILLLLAMGKLDVMNVLIILLITETISTLYLAINYWPDFHFRLTANSYPLANMLLRYGIPLMILESLGLILRISDRYLIELMLGEEFLGQYSASYNLTAYLETILIFGVLQAVRPMYTRLWETDGEDATKAFLSKGLHYYFALGLPIIAIFSLTAPLLLNILASPKYAAGTVVIPYVALSFLFDGVVVFLGAGLYLHKKTVPLMKWGVIATVLNLTLNVLFIPIFGMLGAAVVTIVSYVVFSSGIAYEAFKYLKFPFAIRPVVLIAVVSIIVYLLIGQLSFGGNWSTMIGRGAIATTLLAAALFFLDKEMAAYLKQYWARIRPSRGHV